MTTKYASTGPSARVSAMSLSRSVLNHATAKYAAARMMMDLVKPKFMGPKSIAQTRRNAWPVSACNDSLFIGVHYGP